MKTKSVMERINDLRDQQDDLQPLDSPGIIEEFNKIEEEIEAIQDEQACLLRISRSSMKEAQ